MKKILLMKNTFSRENFVKNELIKFIKDSKKLSMGNEVFKWEKNFSKWQKRKFSICVNSGSSANLILIQSLLNLNYLKKNDLVGVTGITWSTNVMPLIQLGLKVKALDVNIKTLNVSLEILKKFYQENKNLKCFFITNVLGFSDEINKIKLFCKKKDILLIEDNCESMGSQIKKIKLGNFGLASTFSTFVGHHLSTIEGGFVCTDDKKLRDQLLITRAHGWDRNLDDKNKNLLRKKFMVKSFFSNYSFYNLAFNVRPTEIIGKLGNTQINFLNSTLKIREKNFKKFQFSVNQNSNFLSLDLKHMSFISNYAYPIICSSKHYFEYMCDKFYKNNIEIRPVISGNILRQPFIRKYNNQKPNILKNVDYIHNHAFYFPNNSDLNKMEIKRICNILEEKK